MNNDDNFTKRAREAMRSAANEAARLHHSYVSTEHMLLGLLGLGLLLDGSLVGVRGRLAAASDQRARCREGCDRQRGRDDPLAHESVLPHCHHPVLRMSFSQQVAED